MSSKVDKIVCNCKKCDITLYSYDRMIIEGVKTVSNYYENRKFIKYNNNLFCESCYEIFEEEELFWEVRLPFILKEA